MCKCARELASGRPVTGKTDGRNHRRTGQDCTKPWLWLVVQSHVRRHAGDTTVSLKLRDPIRTYVRIAVAECSAEAGEPAVPMGKTTTV